MRAQERQLQPVKEQRNRLEHVRHDHVLALLEDFPVQIEKEADEEAMEVG